MNGQQTQRIRTKAQRRAANAGREHGRTEARKRRERMRYLLAKHQGRCALCGELVSLRFGDTHYATVDHIVPLSRGGLDKPDNWQLAGESCNNAKGSQMQEERA